MKNLKILYINAVIVLVVLGVVSFYTEFQKRSVYENSVKAYENTAHGMENIIASYMSSEQQLVNSWANSINGISIEMIDAIEFARKSLNSTKASVHIVWRDDYSKGYSTQPHILNPDDYSISYYASENLHTYELSPYKVLRELDFSTEGIHLTPSYTNPITGSKVIAFCSLVNLLDNGRMREAIILYVLPVSYLNSKWVFGTEYSENSIAIIEKNGNYIIQPNTFKNTSFYEFMYSYNKLNQETLRETIFGNHSGTFLANDSKGIQNIYAYAIIGGTNNHAVILGMPVKNFEKNTIDWIIILFTLLALMVSLVSNTLFFTHMSHKQQEQVEIISKQGEQLEHALSAAQKANVAKTVFLSNMSHDIRTPMNAIIGFTNLAITHIDNKAQIEDYLQKINVSSNHLLSLINDVLDMSRIESGKVEIEEKKGDLIEFFQNLQTFINADVNERQLDFDISISEGAHYKVCFDQLRLNQIFLNLLSNAIKFTNPGGSITLDVQEVSYVSEGYANYEFHVIDTGIGMKPEFAERVFDPFERERTSTVSGIQGTGLGMAITKSLVDMMNGQISVDTKVGVGTDFKVNLTFKTWEEADEKPVELPVKEEIVDSVSESFDFTGKKVLLVEDNELNQEIAAEILRSFGIEVLLADDGIDAINIIKRSEVGEISLVLMDIQMPHMNGYEATKIIRRLDDKQKTLIPIIAMTANAFEEDKRDAVAAGMNGHLAKPIDINELLKQLKMYLN